MANVDKTLLIMGSLIRFLLLLFLSLVLTFSWSNFSFNGVMAVSPQLLQGEQQAREFYQQGNINRAIESWLTIVEDYQKQGNMLGQGRVLSYLALAYGHLGQWEKADSSINKSLNILQSQPQDGTVSSTLAEAWNIQGTLFLAKGNPLAALSSWEEATVTYEKVEKSSGILRTNINQARALQALGLYTQACQKLGKNLFDQELKCDSLTVDNIELILSNNLNSLEQAGWLSLAQILRKKGDLETSQAILDRILDQVTSQETKADI